MIALLLAIVSGIVLLCSLRWLQSRFGISKQQETMGNIGDEESRQVGTQYLKPLPDMALQAVFVTAEDGTLCECYYTELDCREQSMTLYMVPMDTRLQLSTELYHELSMKNAKLAQINTLAALYRSFTAEDAPECVVKALDEALGVRTDFYLVMPKVCYDRIVKADAHTYAYAEFLQEDLQTQIMAAGSMKAYLTGLWEQCKSSASVESRMYYLETYEGLTNLRISCRLVAGERHNNGYVPRGTGLR